MPAPTSTNCLRYWDLADHIQLPDAIALWCGVEPAELAKLNFETQCMSAKRAALITALRDGRLEFAVMEAAHAVGLRSTVTIMFGHIERYEHWARHFLRVLTLQKQTGGFTEFVPLPFVAEEAPMYLRGRARKGPTFREVILMHAIARLVLSPHIHNIQASWVKLGNEGVIACLAAGVNDLGGTLMNESITRAAGATHGQENSPENLDAMIKAAQRQPQHRSTLYGAVDAAHIQQSYGAEELLPLINDLVTRSKVA